MDLAEGAAPNAIVIAGGSGKAWRTLADESGNYSFKLPPAIYTITTKPITGFDTYRRAAFHLTGGRSVVINLILLPGEPSTHTNSKSSPIAYEYISLPAAGSALNALVQYGSREEGDTVVEYKGVLFSYEFITIKADRARLNKEKLQLEAEGDVFVEDGNGRTYARQVKFSLGSMGPELRFVKGAIIGAAGKGSIENGEVTFEF